MGEFLLKKLKMSGEFLQELRFDEVEATKVQKNRPDNCPDEVLVVFPNKAVHDKVRGSASNLSKLPRGVQAGVRLEKPDFLQANFRALEQIGYRIKRGNPTARRNILFDDEALDLALDVKPADDLDWVRILPEQAKRTRAKVPPPPSSVGSRDRMTLSLEPTEDGGGGCLLYTSPSPRDS